MARKRVHILVLLDVDVLSVNETTKRDKGLWMSAHTCQSSLGLRDVEPSLHQNVLSVAQHNHADIPKRIPEKRTGAPDAFSLLTERFPLRAQIRSHIALVVRQSQKQMEWYLALVIIRSVVISEFGLVVQEWSRFPHLV